MSAKWWVCRICDGQRCVASMGSYEPTDCLQSSAQNLCSGIPNAKWRPATPADMAAILDAASRASIQACLKKKEPNKYADIRALSDHNRADIHKTAIERSREMQEEQGDE